MILSNLIAIKNMQKVLTVILVDISALRERRMITKKYHKPKAQYLASKEREVLNSQSCFKRVGIYLFVNKARGGGKS